MNNEELDELFKMHGQRTGIPWQLIKAIIQLDKKYTYYIKNIVEKEAMELAGSKHRNALNSLPRWYTQISMEVDIISNYMKLYGLLKGIAMSHSSGERSSPANGPFKDQEYINSVIDTFIDIGGDVKEAKNKYERSSLINQ